MNTKEIIEFILSHYVITLGGRYSRGKSLCITALGFFDILFNNRLKFLSNMPIDYSNIFEDKKIEYDPLISTSQFDNMNSGVNIIWDEMQQDLFSRSSQSIKSKYVVIFSRDVAKLGNKILGSFQFGDTIDKVMGFSVEIIIIPEYYEKYSKNIKEDNIQRIENQDFRMNWTIYDKRDSEHYYISGKNFNLYPIIFLYNTKFKMQPLFVNHNEYIEKLKKMDREHFDLIKNDEINSRIEHWNNGLKDIGKINIR